MTALSVMSLPGTKALWDSEIRSSRKRAKMVYQAFGDDLADYIA
jgi:hypothetical protein